MASPYIHREGATSVRTVVAQSRYGVPPGLESARATVPRASCPLRAIMIMEGRWLIKVHLAHCTDAACVLGYWLALGCHYRAGSRRRRAGDGSREAAPITKPIRDLVFQLCALECCSSPLR